MNELAAGSAACLCKSPSHRPQLVVLTGGPGAGKTAVLELARRAFCRHVAILPEAAGILFGGGFPRLPTEIGRRAAQRAIYRVQREVETLVLGESQVAIALCDRGTVDGLAYWPGDPATFWHECATTPDTELARYAAVVHLEPPADGQGYDRSNSLRIETAAEALAIDRRILASWASHPRRFVVPCTEDFAEKALRALELIRRELPACCHGTEPGR